LCTPSFVGSMGVVLEDLLIERVGGRVGGFSSSIW
jgi:hypothetical protein